MFSNKIENDRKYIKNLITSVEIKNIKRFNLILTKVDAKESLALEDAVFVLKYCFDDEQAQNIFIDKVSKNRLTKYKNELYMIVPHYHSSVCIDNCTYCAYRKDNKGISRIRLKDDSFKEEYKLLLDWGYRTFEFVYATDPYFNATKISERIVLAKEIAKEMGIDGVMIGINAEAFSEENYKTMNDCNMDFLVLWMETYNKEIYAKIHLDKTRKGDFNFRVDASERLLLSGNKNYSLGVLLGLDSAIEDASMLIAHGLYLQDKYEIPPYIIGIPKLVNAMNIDQSNHDSNIITDKQLALISWVYKAVFQNTKLFVNSRQTLETNVEIIKGGGDLFTIDFATFPGDYLKGESNSKVEQQFETLAFDRTKTTKYLKSKSFIPKFNWTESQGRS